MFLFHAGGSDAGLISGLIHPVFGLDHLLAMVSVGVISSQLGGKNIWRIPSLFVCAMVFGGILGIFEMPLPFYEKGIAFSLILLGVGITFADKTSSALIISLFVIFFGICHGFAHGVEIPKSVSPMLYTIGFLISTSVLHIFGVVIGEVLAMKSFWLKTLRFSGVIVGFAGVYFLFL